jgi:hypothetical protein
MKAHAGIILKIIFEGSTIRTLGSFDLFAAGADASPPLLAGSRSGGGASPL